MMFFDWISISEDDIILVIDEAHNLPEYLRELYSARLSIFMLQNCINEVEKVGDPNLANGQISVSNFCTALIDIINNLRDTYVLGILENGKQRDIQIKNDAFIPSHEFESEILFRLKIISTTLSDIISDLIAYGEKIQEYRQKEDKLPRSYIYKLGTFLKFWLTVEMNQYIKLIVDSTKGKNPHIEAYCLDPSIATTFINNFHSSIHMSGTLRPLEEYRDSLGLPEDTKLVEYPSPFSIDNRRIFFTRDVTTRYEEIIKDTTIISKMWEHISTICNNFPKNTMVFFPSYNTLKIFQKKGYFSDIERCLYIEEQRMPQSDLIDLVIDFKRCGLENKEGAALFSVIGGRISEGVDFPAKQLEIAVIVGIPYPKPTARQRGLQKYYDLKFGKGWEYTVNAPAARKLLQSIGRLIRDEHDCGVAVILDKRAPRFKQYIQDMKESKNLLVDISRFLNT
jgi:DNA excision repair protein ERCC-2